MFKINPLVERKITSLSVQVKFVFLHHVNVMLKYQFGALDSELGPRPNSS